MRKFERHPFQSTCAWPGGSALLTLMCLGSLLGSLAGCAGGASRSATAPQSSSPSVSVPTVESDPIQRQVIQKFPLAQTWLTLHIGKAGKLARLGHNHLISAPLEGQAWLDAAGTLQAVAQVAVNDLVVDDPQRRAAEGSSGNPDYVSVPTAKNIRDTRANMLGARVLDAAQYPQIQATAEVAYAAAEFKTAASGSLNARFELNIRGVQHGLPAILQWQRSEDQIHWDTSFTISHHHLGMTPFSALGGALRVADPIRVDLQGILNGPFSFSSD